MTKVISKKRILALVCVCCLIVSSCFTGALSGLSVSADATAVPTPSNPTHLTLCDVDMSNIGTINATDKIYAPGFDNTLFSFYMSCNSSNGRIYFAGKGNYSGFCIVYNNDGTVSLQDATTSANSLGYSTVNIAPATVGIESFLTDEVLYQFETHFLDLDAGGEKNDVRLSLSINGVHVATVEVNNRLDRIGNHFYTSGGTRYFRGHAPTEHEHRDAYESWTFSDVGISDGGPQVSMKGEMAGPLDGSMFVGKMYFPTTSFGNFYIGTGDWYGVELEASGSDSLKLQVINGASNLAILNPTDAGVTLRGNDDLTVGISVDYFDLNTSAKTAKLKIGVWFNGELYKGNYFTTGDVDISYLARRIHTYGMNGVYVYSVSTTTTSHTVPEFESFTIADTDPTFSTPNANTGNFTGTIPVDSLDEKVFTAKVNYTANSQQFHYAGAIGSSYSGFTLYTAESGKTLSLRQVSGSVVANFVNADYNAENIFGEGGSFFNEFVLQISTEFVDADYDGNEDDVKLGVWFNGKLGNGHYLYYIDAAAGLGKNISANEGGAPKLCSYYEELPAELSTYEEWTFSDVDRADGTHPSGWAFSPITGETLDKTVFHGYVTFTNSDQIFMLGSTKSYNGYGFTTSSDATILNFSLLVGGSFIPALTLNAADFGFSAFHNEKLELTIASRILKEKDSTYLVEVFPMINNKLPGGKSWTFEIDKSKFTRSLGLANPMVLESIETTHTYTVPADFTKITLNDLGVNKNITNYFCSGYYPGSWDETVLSLNLNFGTWKSRVRYAKGTGGYSGICLYRDGNNIKFGADYTPFSGILTNVVVTPESLGFETFDNQDLTIDFVTDYIDLDFDGEEDDIKVGCFINGVLAGGHYLYGYNGVASVGQGFAINEGWVANLSNVNIPARTINEADYDFYTLSDVGIADGTGAVYGKLLNETKEKIEGIAYDGVMLGAKVKFTQTAARMHYAASDESQFSGVQIRLLEDGSLIVEKYSGRLNYDTVTIDPAQFDLETFANTAFILKLTTDIINANGGEDADDVRLGIWINGKLANNSYLYILDQADNLGCNVNFNEGSATEHYSLWEIDAPADGKVFFYQIDSEHPYLVAADYIISTTGKRFENGAEVYTSGDYTAYFEATDDLQEAEQTVVLWREWDVFPDGIVNILDFIALEKAFAEISPATLAGQLAARQLDTTDSLIKLRKILLGVISLKEEYTYSLAKTDEDGAVMPIGGWVSPTVYPAQSGVGADLAKHGLELNFLQDKYYEMITDLGINQLSYTGKDYNDMEKMSIIKGLSLAEKYGLTAYVNDSGIADNSTSATDLAKRLNAYSRYSSFAGINVADEPHTNSYNSNATTKTVSEIANKSVLINRFTNLIGYSNLYGDYTFDNTGYKAYLAEVIDVLKPKVLSFDHYNGTTSTNGARSYFGSLEALREASLENKIPFIGFISTGEDYAQSPIYTDNMEPTAGDISWNVNTMLAYGAKGYNWFTLIQPWYFALEGDSEIESMDFDRCGLIGANGEATRNYDTAKAINSFVGTIDHILMASTSVDVLATGAVAQYETGISKATYGGMTVSAADSEGAIVGVFDYNGKKAYYVVNYNTDASQNITLSFGSSQNMTIYTENGSTSEMASSKVLSLNAGAAALVVVD